MLGANFAIGPCKQEMSNGKAVEKDARAPVYPLELLLKGYLCKSFLKGSVWEPLSLDFSKIWNK
jgi:hypothetical protein